MNGSRTKEVKSALQKKNLLPAAPVEGLETVLWIELDGDEKHYHDADSNLGRHIASHQKSDHEITLFPLVHRSQAEAIIAAERAENEALKAGIKRLSDEQELLSETTGCDLISVVRLAARVSEAEADNAALTARVKELQEALQPFAEYGADYFDKDNNGKHLPDEQGVGCIYLNYSHFRKARAALEAQP